VIAVTAAAVPSHRGPHCRHAIMLQSPLLRCPGVIFIVIVIIIVDQCR
jgi:hypothetical protein